MIALGIAAAWIGTGLYAWWRRPRNRVGALMTWTGFAWLLNVFVAANSPAIFTLAVMTSNLYLAAFVHLLLAYPDGRLRCWRHRAWSQATYALALAGPIPILMSGLDAACATCPDSVIQVTSGTTIGTDRRRPDDASRRSRWPCAIVQVLTRRWRTATAAAAPHAGAAAVVGRGADGDRGAHARSRRPSPAIRCPGVLPLAGQVVFASIPFTFLIGLLRGHLARADALGALLVRLGEASGTDGLRGLLADALGDRSLQLLYWVDNSWVHRDGRPATLPARRRPPARLDAGRARGPARRRDRARRAAPSPRCCHSLAAAAGPGDARRAAGGGAAALAQADRRGRAGRAPAAGAQPARRRPAAARRAQPDAADRAEPDRQGRPRRPRRWSAGAQEELTRALEELRELARGIHPAVLSDRGLGPAVEALAVRSPLPVKVVEVPGERLPEPVEAAAYFVIAEALTNVAKYANASAATVAVRRVNGHAHVEVRDDGVGGADPGRGSGLRGLADRVGALDGSLALDSPPGSGTTLRAEIPV